MKERFDVFLSYSRNDLDAAALLHTQLECAQLSVFRDEQGIRWSDQWLDRLQEAVATCKSFLVLVGCDGVGRWIGAETQVALKRYFGPHDDAERLPIFPILLGETEADTLPVFLQLFQATTWKSDQPLPDGLINQIRERVIVPNDSTRVDGCPFIGLKSFGRENANLFFGRQKETLDALACFNTRKAPIVRWLEISGNSGCGKSSLMNAGLLPLVEKGWLWRRTGFERWTCIGPMMPGKDPIEMLAISLATAFNAKIGELVKELKSSSDALRYWLLERKGKAVDMAFLLAIDQFEELFTLAKDEERSRFDRLLAAVLEDPECPVFVISTVRADFLDRFDVLPRLVDARNICGKQWTLAPIGPDGLREVIEGPARLASLDVTEVTGLILQQAENEPGALPLVENALEWLWNNQEGKRRLSERRFNEAGGLAGILSHSADDLLAELDKGDRARALELLFRLVRVDPEGFRHARQRMPIVDAAKLVGGRGLLDRLAGQRVAGCKAGPVRLITTTDEGVWVNLIHETLIRSKGPAGKPQPYWPTLWDYIQNHRERSAWLERIKVDTLIWLEKGKNASYRWSHEKAIAALRQVGPEVLSPEEREFLGPIDPDAMLAELNRPETTHKRRLLIGERIDIMGDPRPGIGVDAETPIIDWRPVPGGNVMISIRSDPADASSKVKDRLLKQVGSFQVAHYTITVAQYRAFIEATDGWRDDSWWADLYRDRDGDIFDFGRFGNHPAVYVSWFDAVAFCRWLSRRLGKAVRLPDEWEWQLAATGVSDKKFPWGNDWEHCRGNTRESRLGQITAVGTYPAGASLQGIEDMAGNVWEWCLNKFNHPNVTQSRADDFDLRVLRGGSWFDRRVSAESSSRIDYKPNHRRGTVGFRVVCSSPSSGH